MPGLTATAPPAQRTWTGRVRAKQADLFVDSIGCNVNPQPDSRQTAFPPYATQSAWIAIQASIGIRHTRYEGIATVAQFSENATLIAALAASGITTLLICYNQSFYNQLAAAVGSFTSTPDAIECANEFDKLDYVPGDFVAVGSAWSSATTYAKDAAATSGGVNYISLQAGNLNHTPQAISGSALTVDAWWVAEWVYNNRKLSALVTAFRNANWPSVKVLAGSQYANQFVQGYIGNTGVDIGNYHLYSKPGDFADTSSYIGSIPAGPPDPLSTTKRLWLTEHGWESALTPTTYSGGLGQTHMSEATHAKLLLRSLAFAFSVGYERTYIYELIDRLSDHQDESEYGICRSDGTFKAAATQVQTLITLLADPGAKFVPGALGVTITGATGQLLLMKRDGSFWLLLWQQVGLTSNPLGGAPTRTSSCTTTNGSATVTAASAVAADVGATVSGTGIPANAVIDSVVVGTSFHMTNGPGGAALTATASGTASLTITPFGSGAALSPASSATTLTFAPSVTSVTAYQPSVGTGTQAGLLSGATTDGGGKTLSVAVSVPAEVVIVKVVP